MKKLLLIITAIIVIVLTSGTSAAQDGGTKPDQQSQVRLYDPSLDGMKQINEAVAQAKNTGRHVFIQYGGNWCGWCIKFDAFCKADKEISNLISSGYVAVKLNYDKTNTNDAANLYMGNPARFGFPVFIIIDGSGKVLHLQDSGLLEENSSYNRDKVLGFLRNWTVAATAPPARKQSPTK